MVVNGIFPSKQGYRSIAGKRIYFRSSWEVNFARYLQFMKERSLILDWEYEPQEFWFEQIKRGVRSYKPDFKVTRPDRTHYWVEVKGYMDAKSVTKIKRFKKYYPKEELIVIRQAWFIEHKRKFHVMTENWENEYTPSESHET